MVNQIRYQQQLGQVYQQSQVKTGNIATYGNRDSSTGLRTIEMADGGVGIGRYLSNSTPGGVMPIAQSSTIGLTGYISQKPY
jgi:hypothetical protein